MDFRDHLRTLKTMNVKSIIAKGLLYGQRQYGAQLFQNSFYLNYLPQAFIGFQISDYSIFCFAFEFYLFQKYKFQSQYKLKSRCYDDSSEKLEKNH